MDNKECNVISVDGIEYTEISRIISDGNTYVLLSNLDEPNDFFIRKLVKDNNLECIVELENEREFDKIFKLFSDKYLN